MVGELQEDVRDYCQYPGHHWLQCHRDVCILREPGWPGLNRTEFLAALEFGKEFHDIFGSPAVKFSPTNHLASAETMVQQIQNGRWKVIQTGLMF